MRRAYNRILRAFARHVVDYIKHNQSSPIMTELLCLPEINYYVQFLKVKYEESKRLR